MNTAVQNLLSQHQQVSSDFGNYIQKLAQADLSKTLSDGSGTTYRAVLAHCVRHGYEYIVWIQQAAGLPKIILPGDLNSLGQVDNNRLLGLLNLLPVFARETLNSLNDKQLDGKTYKTEIGNLTLRQLMEQMTEHIIKHQKQIEQSEKQA